MLVTISIYSMETMRHKTSRVTQSKLVFSSLDSVLGNELFQGLHQIRFQVLLFSIVFWLLSCACVSFPDVRSVF